MENVSHVLELSSFIRLDIDISCQEILYRSGLKPTQSHLASSISLTKIHFFRLVCQSLAASFVKFTANILSLAALPFPRRDLSLNLYLLIQCGTVSHPTKMLYREERREFVLPP